jgi:hypothetical protein
MTTGKRRKPGDRAEQPQAEPAEQRPAQRQPALTKPWYRRVSFWRSVAGMALAVALGCAAVALEMASELSSRRTRFNRRVEVLRSRMSGLHTDVADAERQVAALRAEQHAGADVNRILAAKDLMVLDLRSGTQSRARGLVAISRKAGGAIIEVAGLPAAAGQTCVVWWLLAQGPPTKAAEFLPDITGRRSLSIEMPPRSARIAGAMITLEPKKPASPPGETIVLKGVLPSPQVLN